MPRKRFFDIYSKPQSTVHPSLSSGASSSSHNDAPPTVNELIASHRKAQGSAERRPETTTTPTLPPQIRNLLSISETPAPVARGHRRRYDANGRLLPPGPAPPTSWVEQSQRQSTQRRRREPRRYPDDVEHLPTRAEPTSIRLRSTDGAYNTTRRRSLQEMCLRTMARHWRFVEEWERNNLADIPTGLRLALLSNIAVHGADEGISLDGVKTILLPPSSGNGSAEVDSGEFNEHFYRLDLSGSVGRTISLKQVIELVEKPAVEEVVDDDTEELTWEDTLSRTLSPPIPHLTHLSLSHPPPTISWPRLLALSKHLPTLTHLSLAYWPAPSLTPNAVTAVMTTPQGTNIQYGGTNFYSHSLDDDFRESATILRNLASRLYGLEYLDLTACTDWLKALRWRDEDAGIDWRIQWVKLRELKVFTGKVLSESSENPEVEQYARSVEESMAIELMMPQVRRKEGKGAAWVKIVRENGKAYEDFWKSASREQDSRRRRLSRLTEPGWISEWKLTAWQRRTAESAERIATPGDPW